MKPIFLLYLMLVLVTSLIFAVVYAAFAEIVEGNPETFSIGLGMVLLTGMYGMMDDIISNTTHDKLRKYE